MLDFQVEGRIWATKNVFLFSFLFTFRISFRVEMSYVCMRERERGGGDGLAEYDSWYTK